ncbi:hypothetical protein VKT23_013188 [Stygiomarasmius scandens]|uniref:F-box domain-containing protein n=1 Tax=Marasmiellus scandens TaxID=2682957 RepID=A0ABR1J7P7_9AGAR
MTRRSSRLEGKGKTATNAPVESDPEHSSDPTKPQRKRAKLSADDTSSENNHQLYGEEVETSSVGEQLAISEEEDFEAPVTKRKRKRGGAKLPSTNAKTTKLVPADARFKKVRGKLGLLQKVATDMPLDVIFEIFSYLEPLDILRLSRTSLDLRNLLTTRSSEHVWRTARFNFEGLPPLPPDLNEMQFAHLAFDNYCHVCGHHPCDNVMWTARTRCCIQKCIPNALVSYADLTYKYPEVSQPIGPDIAAIIRSTPQISIWRRGHPNRGVWYNASAFAKLYEDYQKIKEEESRTAIEEWAGNLASEHETRNQHDALLEAWQSGKRRDRSDQLKERREQRRQDIENRLIALGWGPEVELLKTTWEFDNHKSFRQAAKVTDGVWAKIGPEFVKMAQDRRASVQKSRRIKILRQRHVLLQELYCKFINAQGCTENQIYPSFGDILESSIFRTILWDTPLDTEVTEDDFTGGFAQVPVFIEDWRESKTQEVVERMREDIREASVNDLRSITSVFSCVRCRAKLWYPQILSHSCCFAHEEFVPDNRDPDYNPYHDLAESPWTKSVVIYSQSSSEAMKTILRLCNLTPDTTTLSTLNELNPIFECMTCTNSYRGRTFMRWLRILHDHSLHDFSIDSFNDIRERVLNAEKPPFVMENGWVEHFLCNKCGESEGVDKTGVKMTFASLATHLTVM